jgi:hypothetical protein
MDESQRRATDRRDTNPGHTGSPRAEAAFPPPSRAAAITGAAKRVADGRGQRVQASGNCDLPYIGCIPVVLLRPRGREA